MLLSGEPGIGKSRLTRRLAASGSRTSRTPACAISARRTTRTAPCTRSSRSSSAPPGSSARTRPRRSWTSWRLLAPASAGGRGAAGRAAVAADRGPLPAAPPHAPAQKGEDLRGAAPAARSLARAASGADALRGCALDRPQLARAARPPRRAGAAPAGAGAGHLPPRVSAALDRAGARHGRLSSIGSTGARAPRWSGGSSAPKRCRAMSSRRSSSARTGCRCSSRS